jgi:hypothetical protein
MTGRATPDSRTDRDDFCGKQKMNKNAPPQPCGGLKNWIVQLKLRVLQWSF